MGTGRRHVSGEILGLAHLLIEHGEDIEADLLRYYQVDLTDLFTGRLSWRRLWVLITRLPRDACLVRAMSEDPQDALWGLPEHLLAIVADRLYQLTYLTVQLNVAKGKNPLPKPTPIARPAGHTGSPAKAPAEPGGRAVLKASQLGALFKR